MESAEDQQKWEDIHVEIKIDATPSKVYSTWLDGRAHTQMLGIPVNITDKVGTKFEIQNPNPNKQNPNGAVHSGVIIELTDGRRMIAAWRHSAWEEGVYSILTIRFVAEGKGTRLVLDQKGVPQSWGGAEGRLTKGWSEFYLPRVQKYFAEI